MDKITYKTKNGIFEFPESDVFERLQYHENELNSLEADTIEKYLSCRSCHPNVVPEEYDYFDIIALELIENEKGTVICKKCDETYKARELKPLQVGHGRIPPDENTQRETYRLTLRGIFSRNLIRVDSSGC